MDKRIYDLLEALIKAFLLLSADELQEIDKQWQQELDQRRVNDNVKALCHHVVMTVIDQKEGKI